MTASGPTVAYAGLPGAFAHEACLTFLPDHRPVAVGSFADVTHAVRQGAADCGMLPIANSIAGPTGAEALIDQGALRVAAEHRLAIRMHLLARGGASLDSIRVVVSHPVALRQCSSFLSTLSVSLEEASNTAVAAHSLTDSTRAALASAEAARIYGLTILREDVHDRPDNHTHFAVVTR